MGKLLDYAAAAASIAAGLYLLQFQSAGGSSWFEVIGHGIGIYFIAKGIYLARAMQVAQRETELLDEIADRLASGKPGVRPSKVPRQRSGRRIGGAWITDEDRG